MQNRHFTNVDPSPMQSPDIQSIQAVVKVERGLGTGTKYLDTVGDLVTM
jgi:hypothetical protein